MGKFKRGKSGGTCRCPMCGKKAADTNQNRQSYFSVNIGSDEHGKYWGGYTKKQTRKLRRTREKRNWKGNL